LLTELFIEYVLSIPSLPLEAMDVLIKLAHLLILALETVELWSQELDFPFLIFNLCSSILPEFMEQAA
jgi:hypothetical protein